MKIEILGTGCPKCKKLSELTAEAIKELGVSAEITKELILINLLTME